MSEQPRHAVLAMDEREPPYDDPDKQPKTLTRNRHIDDILYVAGRAPIENQATYDIMFIAGAVDEDEATQHSVTTFGFRINQPAEYLKGATGIIKDVALRAGIDLDKCYYTAVCKWLLPRMKRAKPPVKTLKWGLPILMDEIKRTKPKIIVCLGKQAFDLLSDRKIGFNDAHGGWFWSTEANAHLYLMYPPFALVGKPELYETFRIDFMEIARKQKLLAGEDIQQIPVRYEVIRDEQSLRDWVGRMEELYDDRIPGVDQEHLLFAVDCEWHGRTHVDGQLRTIQFAWTESDAVVIEFRNEQNEWSFELEEWSSDYDEVSDAVYAEAAALGIGIPADHAADDPKWMKVLEKQKYAVVGRILGSIMNRSDVRYIGHHFSADAPWMEHWLNLNTYRRCVMDTEFAQQTIDESSELGLERGIAMKYTTLGMYNLDLILWKKDNPGKTDGGYGFIPSDILHPYGARDVLAPYRSAPLIRRQLQAQQLEKYYDTILNPYVTDVFTEFCRVGLPIDIPLLDELRELFHFVRREMEVAFKERVYREARTKLAQTVMQELPKEAFMRIALCIKAGDGDQILDAIKRHAPMEDIPKWIKRVQHFIESPAFNIRSPDMMRRWLFEVEGLVPIKTTNQKAKGLPSMAWEKVLELPADRQRLYTPAVDKQTLQILSEQFPTLDELLDLNAVGNLCKAFLKEDDVYIDEETGVEVKSENGLHQWVAKATGRIHPNYSCTETSRSRAWMPNTLNIPSYVNQRVARSVARIVKETHEKGELPEHLIKWVGKDEKELPSLRSTIKAPEGWVLTESDYKTAEMWALCKSSGDKDLERILEQPDPEWAVMKGDNPYGIKQVRVAFSDPGDNGIPHAHQNPEFIMNAWKGGKMLGPVTDDMLERNADGSIKHSGYDIHWSVSERIYEKGREEMVEKIERSAGKVINFCVAENQLVLTKTRGAVAIQNIRLADLLWDGLSWVRHEGVIKTGKKEVIEYQGLRATRLHDVWTDERGKVKLEEARAESLTLTRAHPPRRNSADTGDHGISRNLGATGIRVFLPQDKMRRLPEGALERAAQHGDGQVVKMSVSESPAQQCEVSGQRSAGNFFPDAPLQIDASEVLHGYSRLVAPLHGTRYQSGVQEQGRLRRVGAGELHGRADKGAGLRPSGQRRELLARESPVSGPVNEPNEPRVRERPELSSCQRFPTGEPGTALHLADGAGSDEDGTLGRGDIESTCKKCSCGEAETYDILNAGPLHRFTCSGVLVSNSSAYGASPNSLERKIESDTGVKPEEGVGQKGLDAIRSRQPRATEFLEEMANVPKTKGYYRAASGRIRHCLLHGAGSGVGWRTRNSLESALGREMRNFPMQESVGATAARACAYAQFLYKKLGLKARVMMCLYDSLVSISPLEERFIVARLHDVVMSEVNTWTYSDEYGTRTLQYGVDNEFNYRWSTRPSKTDLAQLEDPTWHPTPDKLKHLLTFRNWAMLVS